MGGACGRGLSAQVGLWAWPEGGRGPMVKGAPERRCDRVGVAGRTEGAGRNMQIEGAGLSMQLERAVRERGGARHADEGAGFGAEGAGLGAGGGAYCRLSGAVQRCSGALPSELSRLGSAPKDSSRRAQEGRGAATLSCRAPRPPTTASTSAPHSRRCRAHSS